MSIFLHISGTEFLGNRGFFKKKNIFFKVKTGANKASFSEHAILIIKRRLFRLMRTLLTKDWPHYLPKVVEAINNSKNPAIGGLLPAEIKSNVDDVLVDAAVGLQEDVDFEKQKKNQAAYERKQNNLQVGDYVYVPAFPPSPLDKSFDSKVKKIWFRYECFLLNNISLFRGTNSSLSPG